MAEALPLSAEALIATRPSRLYHGTNPRSEWFRVSEYADALEASLRAAEAENDRLQSILDRSGRVRHVLTLEAHVEALEAESERLRDYLNACLDEANDALMHGDEEETYCYGNVIHIRRRILAALTPTPTPSEPECICGEINARHCPVHGVGTPSEDHTFSPTMGAEATCVRCDMPIEYHDTPSEPEAPKKNGVFFEQGAWAGYVDGVLVAVGPDRPLVVAAMNFHAGTPSEGAET